MPTGKDQNPSDSIALLIRCKTNNDDTVQLFLTGSEKTKL